MLPSKQGERGERLENLCKISQSYRVATGARRNGSAVIVILGSFPL